MSLTSPEQHRPTRPPRKQSVGVRIGEPERTRLAALADEQDRTFGAEVRRAIKWYLAEVERAGEMLAR